MRFRFKHVPHFTETFAIDIASMNGGGRITYGADCSPNEALVEFARGTDLLIVEATLPRPERTGVRGHLTPEEAAEHACRANVKQVLLTHVSDELDELWVRSCAKRAFAGPDLGRPRGRRLRSVTAVGGRTAWRCERRRAHPPAYRRDLTATGPTATGRAGGGLPLTLPRCRRPAIHSRISTACAVRSTSCSVTSGAARDWPRAGAAFSPRVDVYYYGDPPKAVIKADLAGVDPNEVSLEVRGRALIISGERRPRDTEGRVYQQIEIEPRPVRARDPAGRRRGGRRGAGDLRGRNPAGGAAAGRSARERTAGPDRVRRGTSRKRRSRDRGHPGARRRGRRRRRRADDPARRAAGPPAEGDRRLPEHDDAAGRRPGALGAARERRALPRPHARDGGQQGLRDRAARPRRRLPRRRRGRDRAHAEDARRHAADPRPEWRARPHRRLHRRPSPTSWRASTRSPT